MTEKQISEGNKLIHDFMGDDKIIATLPFTYYQDELLPKTSLAPTDENIRKEILEELYEPSGSLGDDPLIEIKKYNNSWDCLMPVIEKIENIILDNDKYYNFQILGGCYVIIISSHGDELITIDNKESKLDCSYEAVVQFIKWYNKEIENRA